MTIMELVKATLKELGSSPDAVAASLRMRKIRGRESSARRCPLAVYLNKSLGVSGLESLVGDVVEIQLAGSTIGAIWNPQKRFINRFDAGRYPFLKMKGA